MIRLIPVLALAAAATVSEQTRSMTLGGRWDEAVALLGNEIAAAEGRRDVPAQAALRTELGRVLADRSFFHRKQPATARKALEEALAFAQRAGDAKSEASARQYLGQLDYSDAFATKDFARPRATFLRAIATRHRLDDIRGLAESWFYVGLTHEQAGQPDWAMDNYRKSLELSASIGDEVLQSYAHRHIGGIEEERGELDAAEKSISRSLELRRKAGFTVGVPWALIQLADFVERRRGDADRAAKLLQEAVDVAKSARSTRALSAAHTELARLSLARKQPREAAAHAEAALAAAREYGDAETIAAAEKLLEAPRR